jgi:hypothetical protein
MPGPQTARQQPHPVTLFDDLGLWVNDGDRMDPSDQVIFKLLQMKALLATAFELEGFRRGVAVNSQAQSLAVEVSRCDGPCRNRRYVGFKVD